MVLAIDTVDGHGLSKKVHGEFCQIRCCINCLFNSKQRLIGYTLLMRLSTSVIKVFSLGTKCLKRDWLTMLQ